MCWDRIIDAEKNNIEEGAIPVDLGIDVDCSKKPEWEVRELPFFAGIAS